MEIAAEWKLDANQALLKVGPLTAAVDLAAPRHGVHQMTLDAQPLIDGELLGVEIEPVKSVLVDSYVRGGDLVAVYADTPSKAMTTQVYWRAALLEIRAAVCPAIDLEISVQTSLLETRPKLRTRSRLPAGDVAPFGTCPPAQSRDDELFPHCIVFHTPHWKASYVELVHPTAAEASEINERNARTSEITHRLFDCELEKGVILRARMRGLFVPHDGEIQLAADAYLQFIDQPPPLTT